MPARAAPANGAIDLKSTKVRVDFGELVMAEQAAVFDQMEALGMTPNPDTPMPGQGVRFNAIVAWVLLRREHPALTFDEVWNGLPGRNVEVVGEQPLVAAGNAG